MEKAKWFPYIAGNYTLGGEFAEHLNSVYFDSLTPLAWPDNTLLLLNTRTSYDDNNELDSSYGLVARHLLPAQEVIIGVNGYYNLIDSQYDNSFNSFGFGAEVLTHWVDMRFNYYLPQDDQYVVDTTTNRSSRRTATGLATRTITSSTYEAALEGWNAEIGFLIPGLDKYMETRIFGGYYYYDNPFGSDYEGFKARVEAHFLPGVVGEVQWWNDAYLNGGHWTAGIRVSVPFSFYNLATGRNPFEGAAERFRPGPRPFQERMTDIVHRSHQVKTVRSGQIQTGDTVKIAN